MALRGPTSTRAGYVPFVPAPAAPVKEAEPVATDNKPKKKKGLFSKKKNK